MRGVDEQKQEVTNPSYSRIQCEDVVDALGSVKCFLGVDEGGQIGTKATSC